MKPRHTLPQQPVDFTAPPILLRYGKQRPRCRRVIRACQAAQQKPLNHAVQRNIGGGKRQRVGNRWVRRVPKRAQGLREPAASKFCPRKRAAPKQMPHRRQAIGTHAGAGIMPQQRNQRGGDFIPLVCIQRGLHLPQRSGSGGAMAGARACQQIGDNGADGGVVKLLQSAHGGKARGFVRIGRTDKVG